MTAPPFPRNGFALRADLTDPALVEGLALCRARQRAFGGGELDWSRQWEYPWVLAHLPADGAGRRILDAGSGYRFFTPLLAQRGFRAHACDLDASLGPGVDALATRDSLPLSFEAQDLERMSYPDDHFDFICCVSVLEHTPDPPAVAREFRRCLKPGGRLLLTFDVSVAGDRDVPVAAARALVEQLEADLVPVHPFHGRELLCAEHLAANTEVLRTAWFRAHQPKLLPWSFVSRAGLQNLLRGRVGRPFFDLAVIGMALEKAQS